MKFIPKQMSILMIMTSIISIDGLDGIFNQAHGFVLDNSDQKNRTFCKAPERERRGITPLKESLERGDCESFTQTVGQVMVLSEKITPEDLSKSGKHLIKQTDLNTIREEIINPLTESGEHLFLSSGTATLIKPTIILTAAHVVDDCKKNPENCRFVLAGKNGMTSYFRTVYIPQEYTLAKSSVEPLNEKLDKLKPTTEVTQHLKYTYQVNQIIKEKEVEKNRLELLKTEILKYPENSDGYRDINSKISKVEAKIIDLYQKNMEINTEINKIEKTKNYIEYKKTIKLINENQKNRSKYDIAIVQLEGGLSSKNLDFLPIKAENITIPEGKSITTFGVSVNKIKDNKNGEIINNDYQRHISVIQLDSKDQIKDNDQKSMFLTSRLFLPDDYTSKCQLDNLDKSRLFPTRFKYSPGKDSFLKGALQPGDSGGPLIMLSKSAGYQLIGIAREIDYTDCKKENTKEFLPGGSYLNEWTPVSIHMDWINKILAEIEDSGK